MSDWRLMAVATVQYSSKRFDDNGVSFRGHSSQLLPQHSSMSLFSLSRWRPAHLLLGWCAYWAALLIVAIGPAVPAILRATAPNAKGDITASFGDSGFFLTVKELGRVTWSGSVHALTAALWVGIPPLILWALWLRARSGTRPTVSATVSS